MGGVMPRYPRRRRLLPSWLAPLAFAALLYAIIPPLRSLSAFKLAIVFLIAYFILSRLGRAFRPAPGPGPRSTPEFAEFGEMLLELEAMRSLEDRSRPGRAGAGLAARESLPIARQRPSRLRWCGPGETVRVGTYTLDGPLVYVSEGADYVEEASCIDPSLPVGKPMKQPPGSLGVPPEYEWITPAQRAYYLRWLAGGRNGPLPDVGYALLFFYGLERRLLVDEEDHDLVVEEVIRLREVG